MKSHLLFETKLPRGIFQVYSAKPEFDVLTVKQIHSNIILNELQAGNEGDALIGTTELNLAILTADCLPIVILGKKSHAVIHAGWKGLQNNILGNSHIVEMNPLMAYIGPHIRVNQYEVQTDFKNNFPTSDSFLKIENKLFFDLTLEVRTQLKKLYPEIEIQDCGICTFSNELFASFRRNKTTDRNWNIYLPKGNLA